jgi:hypothetical protein
MAIREADEQHQEEAAAHATLHAKARVNGHAPTRTEGDSPRAAGSAAGGAGAGALADGSDGSDESEQAQSHGSASAGGSGDEGAASEAKAFVGVIFGDLSAEINDVEVIAAAAAPGPAARFEGAARVLDGTQYRWLPAGEAALRAALRAHPAKLVRGPDAAGADSNWRRILADARFPIFVGMDERELSEKYKNMRVAVQKRLDALLAAAAGATTPGAAPLKRRRPKSLETSGAGGKEDKCL